jgi:hypothetical protein
MQRFIISAPVLAEVMDFLNSLPAGQTRLLLNKLDALLPGYDAPDEAIAVVTAASGEARVQRILAGVPAPDRVKRTYTKRSPKPTQAPVAPVPQDAVSEEQATA